ncbi:MAG: radical SAM protein [Candidatus Omnitrophica bacterium]|nr:radical SAM protein [Candidatus Omnitrophota bacterium]
MANTLAFSTYNFLLRKYTLLLRRTYGIRAPLPLRVGICLTHRCNAACYMCDIQNILRHHQGELTLAELAPLIERLPGWSIITFTGGEPTLTKDFMDIIRISSRRHRVQVLTNGSMLNKDVVQDLITNGVWLINLSIDAPIGYVHDKIRGLDGILQKATAAMREISKIKRRGRRFLPKVIINTIILKETIPLLPEMIEFAYDLGADGICLTPDCRLTGSDLLEEYRELDKQYLRSQIEKSASLAKKFKLHFRLKNNFLIDDIMKLYVNEASGLASFDMNEFSCYVPWTYLYILPDGSAKICDTIIGNIKNECVKTLWNNQKALAARKSFLDNKTLPPRCINCCHIFRN